MYVPSYDTNREYVLKNIIILVLFVSFQSQAKSAEIGWQDIPWNSTNYEIQNLLPNKIKKTNPTVTYGENGEMYSSLHIPNYKIFEQQFTINFLMSSATGKLIKINIKKINLPESGDNLFLFKKLDRTLTQKYGAFSSQENNIADEGINESYGLSKTWISKNHIISLSFVRVPNVMNHLNIQYEPAKSDSYDKL